MDYKDPSKNASYEFAIKQFPLKVDHLNNFIDKIQPQGWDDKNVKLIGRFGEELQNMAKALGIKAIEDLLQEFNQCIAKKETLPQLKLILKNIKDVLIAGSPVQNQNIQNQNIIVEPVNLRPTLLLGLNDTKLTKEMLEQSKFFNYHSVTFSSLDEIIKSVETKRKIGAIVLDVEYCQNTKPNEIKSHFKNIPLIFISKESDMATRIFCAQAGGIALLTKPIEFTNLIEKINRVATPSHELSPYRVLIIGDSPAQCISIGKELNRANMNVEILHDPLLLSLILNDFQPDLILIDLYMPQCTGIELAKVIRQQDLFVSIPIVFISAEADPNKKFNAIFLGGDDFLTKPLNSTYLVDMIMARAKRFRTLHQEMIQDSLTGLLNHTRLLEQLEMEIARAKRSKTSLCFAMLDLDNFKIVNDTHGHPVGDRVIKCLAKLLQQQMRKYDSIGRYGGEEFALIFPQSAEVDVYKKLEDIKRSFASLHHHNNDSSIEFTVTFSAGLAQFNAQNDTVDKIVQAADKALYLAKKQGRNRIITSNHTD